MVVADCQRSALKVEALRNPVAKSITRSYNVQQDKTVTDLFTQINWGDSPAWDTNSSLTLDPTTGYVLIKGSHNYQASGTTRVTGWQSTVPADRD